MFSLNTGYTSVVRSYEARSARLIEVSHESLPASLPAPPGTDAIEGILLEEPFRSLSEREMARLRLRLLTLSLWFGCDLDEMQLRSLEMDDKVLPGGQVCGGARNTPTHKKSVLRAFCTKDDIDGGAG